MIKPGKVFLSGGLILASGAYAWWHHATEIRALSPVTVALRQARAAASVAPAAPPSDNAASTPAAQPAPPVASSAVPAPPSTQDVARAEPKVQAPKTETGDAALRDALVAGIPAPPPPAPLAPPPPAPDTAAPAQTATTNGHFTDGDFVGQSFDGEWGPVQVKVAVRGGSVVQVVCIEYPFHRQRSAEISEYAIPILVEETIKTQDAKIDWVSQASYTSEQFQQSLGSALRRAEKPPAS